MTNFEKKFMLLMNLIPFVLQKIKMIYMCPHLLFLLILLLMKYLRGKLFGFVGCFILFQRFTLWLNKLLDLING